MSLFAIVLSASVIALAPGERMPILKSNDLAGKSIVLPDAAAGKPALLAFGFTYDSRFAVEAWVKQFRQAFPNPSAVTFFEIPMIGGMARLGKWFIDSGMRKGTPVADHSHVVTVYGGTGEWKERLGVRDGDAAYLLLLDPSGRIAWSYGGAYDAAKFEELRNVTKTFLQP